MNLKNSDPILHSSPLLLRNTACSNPSSYRIGSAMDGCSQPYGDLDSAMTECMASE